MDINVIFILIGTIILSVITSCPMPLVIFQMNKQSTNINGDNNTTEVNATNKNE